MLKAETEQQFHRSVLLLQETVLLYDSIAFAQTQMSNKIVLTLESQITEIQMSMPESELDSILICTLKIPYIALSV